MDYRKIIQSKAKLNYKVVIFDFDGTLTTENNYPNIGKPNKPVIEKAKWLRENGYEIIISSCRWSRRLHTAAESTKQRDNVKAWLKENDVPYDQLWEDDKPFGAIYIDDRGLNVEDIYKMEKMLKEKSK